MNEKKIQPLTVEEITALLSWAMALIQGFLDDPPEPGTREAAEQFVAITAERLGMEVPE